MNNNSNFTNYCNSDNNNFTTDFGIEGYNAPKIYFDHVKLKKDREIRELNQEVLEGKKKYPKPKYSTDKEGNIKIPVRDNFIDDILKLANSYYSVEKADIVLAKIRKNSNNKSSSQVSNLYKHDRITYLNQVMIQEKKKFQSNDFFDNIIIKAKNKQSKYKGRQIKIRPNFR